MKIKINNTTYKIEYVDKPSMGNGKYNGLAHFDGRDKHGYIKKKRNTIEVQKGDNQKAILFHEIVHILLEELEIKKKHLQRLTTACNNNENFVDGMALLMMECFNIKYEGVSFCE